MKNLVTVKFNKKAVKGLTRDQFMKAHKALASFVNLEEEYLKINPIKEKTEKQSPEKGS